MQHMHITSEWVDSTAVCHQPSPKHNGLAPTTVMLSRSPTLLYHLHFRQVINAQCMISFCKPVRGAQRKTTTSHHLMYLKLLMIASMGSTTGFHAIPH